MRFTQPISSQITHAELCHADRGRNGAFWATRPGPARPSKAGGGTAGSDVIAAVHQPVLEQRLAAELVGRCDYKRVHSAPARTHLGPKGDVRRKLNKDLVAIAGVHRLIIVSMAHDVGMMRRVPSRVCPRRDR
jgi:hypothetical protein